MNPPIDDPEFERAHPDLGRYAKEHPGECQELKQNPDRFIHEDFKG